MQFDRRQVASLDMAKGMLITCIVLAHDQVLNKSISGFKAFFYNWHVFAFFAISFLLPFRAGVGRKFIETRIIRYMVPFAIFAVIAWFAKLVLEWSSVSLPAAVGRLLLALVIGSPDTLDRGVGVRVLWFLPTLLGLIMVRYAAALSGKIGEVVLWSLGIVGFLTIGLLSRDTAQYIPLGLPIALYMLLPGLIFAIVMEWIMANARVRIVRSFLGSVLIFVVTYMISRIRGTSLALDLYRYYDFRDPIDLLNHAILGISATVCVVSGMALLPRLKWLEWYGQGSLVVYLTHLFILTPLLAAGNFVMPHMSVAFKIAYGFSIFLVAIVACALLIILFERFERLRKFVLPRDMVEWRSSIQQVKTT